MNKRFELELLKKINNQEVVNIKLTSKKGLNLDNYNIVIDNKNYNINSQNLFNKIKEFVSDNIDALVYNAKVNDTITDESNLIKINVKKGQLELNIETTSLDGNSLFNEYVNEIVSLIKENGEKKDSDYFMEMIDKTNKEPLEEDEELLKYFKIFEERFGRKAYIAEPGGTREKTIEAIKICLKEDKDILDELLFPDKKDGVIY